MSKQVRLVFFGEILPGADPAAARQNLARALRADPAQADSLFSGQRIVIKPELPETEAGRYIAHLAGLGVQVIAEPIVDAPPPASPFATAPPARPLNPAPKTSPFASAPTPVAGLAPDRNIDASAVGTGSVSAKVPEVTCPACGTVQPKRVLCKQCGGNIQALIDAKRDEAEFAAEVRKAEAEIKARKKAGKAGDEDSDVPKIFSFDFSGRMGRLTYLLATLLVLPMMAILALIAFKDQNAGLMIAAFVIPSLINLRASILRCHDLNWSGWFVLLSVVPYLGWLFSLILLLAPGTATLNNYGDRPGASPVKHVFYALGLCAVVGAFVVQQMMSFANTMQEQAVHEMEAAQREASPAPARRERVVETAPAADPAPGASGRKTWDGSVNTVVIYTVGDCTPCIERRKELARIGLWPREVRADLNEPASEEMVGKMVRAGLPISSMQMPVIDVNGTILNNPTVEQVEKYLR